MINNIDDLLDVLDSKVFTKRELEKDYFMTYTRSIVCLRMYTTELDEKSVYAFKDSCGGKLRFYDRFYNISK